MTRQHRREKSRVIRDRKRMAKRNVALWARMHWATIGLDKADPLIGSFPADYREVK
jgi:hypothetical protein